MTDRISLGLLATLTLLLALSPPAQAQNSERSRSARFREEFSITGHQDPLALEVFRAEDQREPLWQVQIHSAHQPDSLICHSTLPPEAAADAYNIQLHQLSDPSKQTILLLESKPTKEARRLDPPVYQIAFLIRPPQQGERQMSCTVVARGEYTELDGGPALSLSEDLPPMLIRRDAERSHRFCGLRSEETVEAERFDLQSGQFRPLGQPEIKANGAIPLQATLPQSPIPPPMIDAFYMWVAATSDHRGAPPGAALARPLAMGDLDLSTAWIASDEEKDEPDYLTAALNDAAHLRGLRVFPGHGQSPEYFEHYSRPAQLLLSLEEGQRYLIDLPDLSFEELHSRGGLFIELPEPAQTRCASILIMNTYPGTSQAVAIAEITPYSQFDTATKDETAQQIIAAIADEPDRRRRDRIAELATPLPQAITAAMSDTLQEEDQDRRERTLSILGHLPPTEALPTLKDHFHRVDPDDQDYRLTKRMLASFDDQATKTLFAILDDLGDGETKKYHDILRLIGRVATPEELAQLAQDLGQGDVALRRERARALASAGEFALPLLLSTAKNNPDSPQSLDALTAIIRIGKLYFPDGAEAPDQADQLWQIYEISQRRAHRIRAIEALGYLLHPQATSLFQEKILAVDPDPILRSFAAQALRNYPGSAPRELLEEALNDASPDVRIAAIETLTKRSDSPKAAESTIAYIKRERWPQGLSFAVRLLATSPSPQALEALAELITTDMASPTSATALRALRRNKRSLPSTLVEELLQDPSSPHRVQSQLVDMLSFADEPQAERALIAIADDEYPHPEHQTSEQSEELQRRALIALGARGSANSTDYLLAIVADPNRQTSHREAALRGLAFVSHLSTLQQLQDLASTIPSELRAQLRQTISIIRNRLAMDDADREIQQRLRRLEEQENQDSQDEQDLP